MALIPGRGRLRKEYARYSLTARSGISNPIFCSAILPSRSNRASEARRSAICMAPCVDSPDVGAMTGTGAAAACILGAAGAVTGVAGAVTGVAGAVTGTAGATTGAWAEVPEGDPRTASRPRADATVRAGRVVLKNRDWKAIIN